MKFTDIPQFTREGNWECNYPIDRLVKQIDEWEREEGLNMCPDFQRGHVWTEDQQVAFVEFILRGGSTGRVIYLNDPNWGKYSDIKGEFVCVDGLQRVTALRRFVNNEIKVFGHYHKEFEGNLRMVNDMKINVNNLETRKEVLNWYLEMNSGGTPHTQEELDRVKRLIEDI